MRQNHVFIVHLSTVRPNSGEATRSVHRYGTARRDCSLCSKEDCHCSASDALVSATSGRVEAPLRGRHFSGQGQITGTPMAIDQALLKLALTWALPYPCRHRAEIAIGCITFPGPDASHAPHSSSII